MGHLKNRKMINLRYISVIMLTCFINVIVYVYSSDLFVNLIIERFSKIRMIADTLHSNMFILVFIVFVLSIVTNTCNVIILSGLGKAQIFRIVLYNFYDILIFYSTIILKQLYLNAQASTGMVSFLYNPGLFFLLIGIKFFIISYINGKPLILFKKSR